MLDQFKKAHNDVMKVWAYRSDQDKYGTFEKWTIPGDREGDCDDFALTVRSLCPDLKTRLVECTVDGKGHLVLEYEGYISDCLLPCVHARDELDYVWKKISGYEPGDPWRKL